MQNIYVLRFWRSDEQPNEEYLYLNIEEALEYYKAYQYDSNDTYFAIELIEQGKCNITKALMLLGLSPAEKKIILDVGCGKQFDTCLQLRRILPLLSDDIKKGIAITARTKIENLSPSKFPMFFELLKKETVN